ncbi:hypothetical protein F4604DRAFT_1720679 [Suillus subluteus]|nr:hypothetical protein F4604DRAFT_1720679 [Suillus subluteus]
MSESARKRKPRDTPPSYQRQQKKPKVKNTPVTSAQPATVHTARQNLTLSDWLTVFAYVDAHPTVSQSDIVNHFKNLQTGAFIFTQSTLSRKLRERSILEARINDNPNALSSKRPHIVTRPDVERAQRPAFKAVMDAEGDSDVAISAVEQLEKAASHRTGLKIRIPARRPLLTQLTALEEEARNRIFGRPLSMDEFLEPSEVEIRRLLLQRKGVK